MSESRETLERRWSRLKPHAKAHGPSGRRPTVLLFHGCGGVRPHLDGYARTAVALGARAVVVDSFAPRGWNRALALALVCSGALFRGPERAGDVLAAVHGAIQDFDADPEQLILAGWSHGSWSIMDLMTMPLVEPGEAGLADPSDGALAGVKGVFLAYPYGGVGALSRTRPWVRTPRVLGMLAERDHVTRPRDAERVYQAPQAAGVEMEIWRVNGTHAFEEPDTGLSPMRYDEALAAEAMARFQAFVAQTLALG